MSEVVFILGAGASNDANAPLMNDFLDVADELRKSGKVSKEHFDRVFAAKFHLDRIHSKSTISLNNIESLFAAFEMARIINKFPGIECSQIESLISSIKFVIIETLENTLLFPVRDNKAQPTISYNNFAKLLHDFSTDTDNNPFSIITFNYDIALDFALYCNGFQVDYHLSNSQPRERSISLMKLHGSLNWGKCSECKKVISIEIADYMQNWRTNSRKNKMSLVPRTHFTAQTISCCDKQVMPDPVIVPPTWNKTIEHNLKKVWNRAALELSSAERIVVIGYSLPESDLFFKFLYSLGSVGDSTIKSFEVFDPDTRVHGRFGELLGPGCKDRFNPSQSKFAEAINELQIRFENNRLRFQ